jgi:Na+-transporting NADH:ubiquinone oxidoreductase subunit A
MGNTITIRRGYDIKLKGTAEKKVRHLPISDVVAIKPADFPKIKPKLTVEPGESIKAGQCLFTDKLRPDLRFTSPISGEIAEIILGEKRKIREIRILPDKENIRYVEFNKTDPSSLTRQQLIERLVESGGWNFIRQRPYSTIAEPTDQPKAIFISCFDTSPLAPDLEYLVNLEPDNFQMGLKALYHLADGKVHLGLREHTYHSPSGDFFSPVPEANIHYFKGPHPAGNVGIQIHHIDPLQKGEVVWYIHPQDIIIIGRLFTEGRYRADRIIALAGSSVEQPQYYSLIAGQHMSSILNGKLTPGDVRVIQGNVLHGHKSNAEDFLSFYTQQVTIIPEGREPEFLGWLLPGFRKLSLSRTYFSWLAPKRKYALDTNLHGEERAFVMTGQYDKVLPMNIYPVFLLKAILARDIENMEALGIYEVSEEDFALCEFVCTSKIDVQQIIAEGLDFIREEG